MKKQLAFLCAATTLGGALSSNTGARGAQDKRTKAMLAKAMLAKAMLAKAARDGSKLSRDEAASLFVLAMNQPNIAFGLLDACVCPSNRARLRFGINRMLREMSENWKRPTRIIGLQSQTARRAVVLIGATRNSRVSRPLILSRENGGWGVDLIETYASWNGLRGAAKAKAIYQISEAVLPELPQNDGFK